MTDPDFMDYGLCPMIRIQALREFRREFFHALRNGLAAEAAADQAIDRIKRRVLEELRIQYPDDDLTRMEKWGDILGSLVEFQILLKDIPVDPKRINEIPPKVP